MVAAMFFYDSPSAARLFDLQHEDDPVLERERDFFLEEMTGAQGPILDMGCGTGRVLLPALKRGMDVWGCDYSVPFLARLVAKGAALGLKAHTRICCCDLEEPSLAKAPNSHEPSRAAKSEDNPPVEPDNFAGFRLVFSAFRTFDHLCEQGARQRFLQVSRDLLRPGGRLLLNLANPDPRDLLEAAGQKFLMRDDLADPDTGLPIVWWGTSRFEPGSNLIHESFLYDFLDREGRVVDSLYFPFTLRWTPRDEMLDLVEKAGFETAACWGGFRREPFELGSGDVVWDLRKQ